MDQNESKDHIFDVNVSGNPPISVRSSIVNDYRSSLLENSKVIVYSNSKKSVEDSLVPMANLALCTAGVDGNCMAFTGDDGVMQKIYLMRLFCSQLDELDEEVGLGYRLMILAATTSANCGVSSPNCHRVYQLGLPTNFYNLVQGMGRCDRSGYNWQGDDRYEIHVSYPLFLSLYVRCICVKDARERQIQIDDLFRVLRFVMTPEECHHVTLERYFDSPDIQEGSYDLCEQFCSFCKGDYREHCGRLRKLALHRVLSNFSMSKDMSANDIISWCKLNAGTIFAEKSLPKKLSAPYHALVMQLIARGVLVLDVIQHKKH
jgi:hypothetical protein